VPATIAACGAGGFPAPSGLVSDYDRQFRPQLRTLRVTTPWDLGADELPGVPVPLLATSTGQYRP
jgi:hypothetical protein